MLAENLHQTLSLSNVCDKQIILLSHKPESERPAEVTFVNPPTPVTTQTTEEEEPVDNKVLLSAVYPTSLT